jgi:hypothetical protein
MQTLLRLLGRRLGQLSLLLQRCLPRLRRPAGTPLVLLCSRLQAVHLALQGFRVPHELPDSLLLGPLLVQLPLKVPYPLLLPPQRRLQAGIAVGQLRQLDFQPRLDGGSCLCLLLPLRCQLTGVLLALRRHGGGVLRCQLSQPSAHLLLCGAQRAFGHGGPALQPRQLRRAGLLRLPAGRQRRLQLMHPLQQNCLQHQHEGDWLVQAACAVCM